MDCDIVHTLQEKHEASKHRRKLAELKPGSSSKSWNTHGKGARQHEDRMVELEAELAAFVKKEIVRFLGSAQAATGFLHGTHAPASSHEFACMGHPPENPLKMQMWALQTLDVQRKNACALVACKQVTQRAELANNLCAVCRMANGPETSTGATCGTTVAGVA